MKRSFTKNFNNSTSTLAGGSKCIQTLSEPTSPLAGEDEFQHEDTSVRNSGEGYEKTAHREYKSFIKNKARELRKNSTPQERKIWNILKNNNLGVKFRRQVAIDNKYIADFICYSSKIIIEIDGGQHNQSEQDKIRTLYLANENFKVIRFWNSDIDNNIDECINVLKQELNTPHPVF
jgi:very-short-patch-repair endonuclease